MTHSSGFWWRWYRAAAAWIGAMPAFVTTLVVGAVVAIAASAGAARVYDAVTDLDGVAGLDRPILDASISARNPVVDSVAAGCAYLFGTVGLPIIAVVAIAVFSVWGRSWMPGILIAAAGVGSLLMTIAGKSIVGRARPPRQDAIAPFETSPSFPSGHSLNALVVVGIITYVLLGHLHHRSTKALIIVAASMIVVIVGLSRILLGAHWFTDVLASWTLGIAWLAIIMTAHRVHLAHRESAPRAAVGR